MKPKLLYTIILLLNFTTFVAYSQDYYWYDDAKIHLTIGDKEYIVYEPHTTSPNNATGVLCEEDIVASNQQTLKMGIIAKDTNLSRGEHSFLTNLNKLNNGVYLLVTQIDDKNSIDKFANF